MNKVVAMNKKSSFQYMLKLSTACGISIKDADCADGVYVLMGFYSHDLIDRITKGKDVVNDVLFIDAILDSEDEKLLNALEIDLIENLKTEQELDLFEQFLKQCYRLEIYK